MEYAFVACRNADLLLANHTALACDIARQERICEDIIAWLTEVLCIIEYAEEGVNRYQIRIDRSKRSSNCHA